MVILAARDMCIPYTQLLVIIQIGGILEMSHTHAHTHARTHTQADDTSGWTLLAWNIWNTKIYEGIKCSRKILAQCFDKKHCMLVL